MFLELTRRLDAAGVRYVIVGGVSATLQGVANWVTNDLDICYADDEENRERLATLLDGLGARYRQSLDGPDVVVTAEDLNSVLLLNLQTVHGQIDVLRRVPGVGSYDACLASANAFDTVAGRVYALDPSAILEAKRMANREKDYAHILAMESAMERSAGVSHPRALLYFRLPSALGPAIRPMDALTVTLGAFHRVDSLLLERMSTQDAVRLADIDLALRGLPDRGVLAREVTDLVRQAGRGVRQLIATERAVLDRARLFAGPTLRR